MWLDLIHTVVVIIVQVCDVKYYWKDMGNTIQDRLKTFRVEIRHESKLYVREDLIANNHAAWAHAPAGAKNKRQSLNPIRHFYDVDFQVVID